MKIKETIERECCSAVSDFKPNRGPKIPGEHMPSVRFCVHCGTLWTMYRAPGDMDSAFHPVEFIDHQKGPT